MLGTNQHFHNNIKHLTLVQQQHLTRRTSYEVQLNYGCTNLKKLYGQTLVVALLETNPPPPVSPLFSKTCDHKVGIQLLISRQDVVSTLQPCVSGEAIFFIFGYTDRYDAW